MNHHQTNINKTSYDECLAKGICSISPSLSFLQEVIKTYLRELTYYLLKLKELGITNEKIKENIIEIVSGLIINVHYSEEQFSKTITVLYADLTTAKDLYTTLCVKNNIEGEFVKPQIKFSNKIATSDAIKLGQKVYTRQNKKMSIEQKNLIDLLYEVSKSICIYFNELNELNFSSEDAYDTLLNILNISTLELPASGLEAMLEKAVNLNNSLLMKVHEVREQRYGKLVGTEVNTTTRPNKAILVSGRNIRELELLLIATKDRGIDVYTHGKMLMAHSFPKLKAYPHLVGSFGKGADSYLLDFAAFPGAIYITRHSFLKVDNLYRSRIFTSDFIAPKGVVVIKNNNFEPLIESALNAKGFTDSQEHPPISINVDENKILEKISEVADKIAKKEIKHFIVIGVGNGTISQKEYFEKFLNLLGDDSFVLSFSYTNGADNVLLVNTDYSYSIFYKVMANLTKKIKISDLPITVLFARCDVHTVSVVLHLKYMGVQQIYFTDCPPTLINPALITSMRSMFDLQQYSTPESDAKALFGH